VTTDAKSPSAAGANPPSSSSGWITTWSAPASRCARTVSSAACGPAGMTAEISRSLPPSAKSAGVKPNRSRLRV
jgi:hypothetical protein